MHASVRGLALTAALCAALATATLAGPLTSADPSSASVWLGWRGLTQEGRSPVALPLRWDAGTGIAWKAAVPGGGHSSPIVDADRVYVSTAYPERSGWLASALDGIVTGLATLLVILATREVAQLADAGRLSAVGFLVRSSATIAIAFVLFVLAWLGEGLFDFPRCDIRAWLASAFFVTLASALALMHIPTRAGCLLGCAAAVTFAIVVGVCVPSKEHAFRGGAVALNSQVVFTTLAMPLGLGLAAAWRASPRRGRRFLPVIVLIGLGITGAFLLRHLLVFRNDSLLEVTYVPRIAVWSVAAVTAAALGVVYVFCVRSRTRTTAMAAAIATAVSLIAGVVAIGEQIAARSNYLAYHIGDPKFAPQIGGAWALAAACAAIVLYGLAAAAPRGYSRITSSRHGRLVPSLRICALVLAAMFFSRTNYVHADSRLVRGVVAFDRATGAVRWTSPAFTGPADVVDGRNSPATPTPVSDGERVCAYFGNPGVVCVDRDGRPLWSRNDVSYTGYYGVGFSPVLSRGVLVLASDVPQGIAVVHAFDVKTGARLWRREFRTLPATSGNNRTPIVKTIAGEPTLILWGRDYLRGLRLRDGEDAWRFAPSPGGDLVSSVTSDEEHLYLSDVTGTVALSIAALSEGRDPVRWRNPARANCVSPVVCGGLLFTLTDAGVLSSVRADTGQTAWRHRLSGYYFSSLLASPETVFATNSEGVTTVVACDSVFRLLARNDIDEPVHASLAAAGGMVFLRGAGNLYAIGGR